MKRCVFNFSYSSDSPLIAQVLVEKGDYIFTRHFVLIASFPPPPSECAYLLVFHGSPDPRPQRAVTALAGRVAETLHHLHLNPSPFAMTGLTEPPSSGGDVAVSALPLVGTASLECHPLPLRVQIQEFGDRAVQLGCTRLKILPLFLLAGRHVVEDLPREVNLAQQQLPVGLELEMMPHLGSHANLSRLLATYLATTPVEAWVLLAHGSRKTEANGGIVTLAERLGASPAFWAVAPGLGDRVGELYHQGYRQIAVLPYFLFAGELTDAIARLVTQLSQQFPELALKLTPPLEGVLELADLSVDLFQDGRLSLTSS